MTRKYTTKLWKLIEEGVLDQFVVIKACLNCMSEDDVRDMCQSEGLIDDDEETEEECQHKWSSIQYSRFTHNPHRICEVCGAVTLDLNESEEEEDEDDE